MRTGQPIWGNPIVHEIINVCGVTSSPADTLATSSSAFQNSPRRKYPTKYAKKNPKTFQPWKSNRLISGHSAKRKVAAGSGMFNFVSALHEEKAFQPAQSCPSARNRLRSVSFS